MFLPKPPLCSGCLGVDLEDLPLGRRGRLYSYSVVRTASKQFDAPYAVAYVVAAKDVTGAQLLMGSNDQGKVYLNGKEVVKFAETRTLDPDTDKATGLTLKAGVNVVVFKVINENNNWQGCLRFTDAAGKNLAGLTLKLAP